jgi:hypothetical protein
VTGGAAFTIFLALMTTFGPADAAPIAPMFGRFDLRATLLTLNESALTKSVLVLLPPRY